MINKKSDEFTYLRKTEELFDVYVNQVENRSAIRNDILANIKESNRFDVGRAVCESSEELVRDIGLLENEVMAVNSLKRYNESLKKNTDESNYVLLEVIAQTALSMVEDSETNVIDAEKKNVWFRVFKDVDVFPKLFDETFIYWQNWRAENIKKYTSTDISIIKETIESFKVIMPIELNVLNVGVKECVSLKEINNKMVEDLIKSFNDFELNEYMDIDYVNKLTLQRVNDNWEFSVACNRVVSSKEKAEFMDDLVGQLVDGWGEGQEQKYKLIGNKEYNLYFDYKNVILEDEIKFKKKF